MLMHKNVGKTVVHMKIIWRAYNLEVTSSNMKISLINNSDNLTYF